MPEGDDGEFDCQQERDRPRQKSDGQSGAAEAFQNADEVSPAERHRQAKHRYHMVGEALNSGHEQLVVTVKDENGAGNEANQSVAIGRDALIEPGKPRNDQSVAVNLSVAVVGHRDLPVKPAHSGVRSRRLIAYRNRRR